MRTYTLSLGQSIGYQHSTPDRTAYKLGSGLFSDNIYQIWPNRKAMAKTIRMQQKRARTNHDWIPLVKLSDGEGY